MSDLVKVRKYVATVEETLHDFGPALARPVTKAVVGGVIANPYAGRHEADIQPMMKALEPLAVELTGRVMKILDAKGSELEAYGKGAIVGLNGELEHAALWHQPSGFGIRHAMGGAKSIVPSTVKVATAGARIDIPLHPIKIGEINSYKAQPAFLGPYKKGDGAGRGGEESTRGRHSGPQAGARGWMRDDNGNPGDAVRAADASCWRARRSMCSSAPSCRMSAGRDRLRQAEKGAVLAAEPLTDKIVWENGNRYTFRLRASTYMQAAMLVPEAAAKLKKKRWAIVYPNYEYGQSAAATFKKLLKAAQPDVEFVAEQAPPLGKVDAGSVVQALADAKPDADLQRAVRPIWRSSCARATPAACSRARGGEPADRRARVPRPAEGARRRTAGSSPATPGMSIKTPEHTRFLKAYQSQVQGLSAAGIGGGLRRHSCRWPQAMQARPVAATPKSWSPPSRG
jgi:hypothetical protein